ncbi:MAG: maleylpyruvate isomerase family mycothiol-dependent enzyme [Acidimicrobiia bacterium]|nr:maleylpyruvate isomerase family mycothiol-dependent enzyme [Acidimicrobiia bacterium]
MQVARHIEAIQREGRSFAAAARRAGFDTPVPTCPGWSTRDLVRHLGEIHLWAAAHVAHPDNAPHYATEAELLTGLSERWPELGTFWVEDDELIDWYLRTNANLIHALETAPADLDAWTFLPAPTPLAMWARRQAHETAIHRFDAQLPGNDVSPYDPGFASDGIDELVSGITTRRHLDVPVTRPQTMVLHATDTGDSWFITLEADSVTTRRANGSADVTVTADASTVYLVMWNRIDDSAARITGNEEVLDTWHRNFRVRWYQSD